MSTNDKHINKSNVALAKIKSQLNKTERSISQLNTELTTIKQAIKDFELKVEKSKVNSLKADSALH